MFSCKPVKSCKSKDSCGFNIVKRNDWAWSMFFGLILHFEKERFMKKTHIIILVLIAAAITVLISYTGDLTTYETITSAKQKEGKFVTLIAKLDKSQPLEYDAIKNPNYLTFIAQDTLGNTVKVVYHNTKPTDMEKSERIVLKGKMVADHFECKDILLKCPSKYKDDVNGAAKSIQSSIDKATDKNGFVDANSLMKK
jgi:cytochrome c-type biogenesis protein CcmE